MKGREVLEGIMTPLKSAGWRSQTLHIAVALQCFSTVTQFSLSYAPANE